MSSLADKQRQLKEQAAQEAIYEATLKVIVRQQGEQLKMQDIADTAGIATGTLYNYFKNKVELLTFVDDKLHTIILSKIEEVSGASLPPDEKLSSVVREVFAFFKEYYIVFDLAEKFGIRDKIPMSQKEEGLNQARGCITRILSEGIQSRQFRNVDPIVTAKYFFSTIIGVIEIQKWLRDYEVSKASDELAEFFLSFLRI